MKIAIGADAAGFAMKAALIAHLTQQGYEVKDFGTYNEESCDYPLMAKGPCQAVQNGDDQFGILVCGTGIGMSMAANKHKGIRAAVCSEHFSARYTRLHNDANVICLGARVIGDALAMELVELFLTTEFEGGRHGRRVDQMSEIEKEN